MGKLDTVEPTFRAKIVELLAAVETATKRKWGVSDGRRTMAEQRTIYAQGRTSPGKVVSNAKPGQSAHNFGLAVDCWPLDSKGGFDWGASDANFRTLADIAVKMGLVAGYYFKSIHDAPHIEDPLWRTEQKKWQDGILQIP